MQDYIEKLLRKNTINYITDNRDTINFKHGYRKGLIEIKNKIKGGKNMVFQVKKLVWQGTKRVLLVAGAGALTALVNYFTTLQSSTSYGSVFLIAIFACNSGLNWIKYRNI